MQVLLAAGISPSDLNASLETLRIGEILSMNLGLLLSAKRNYILEDESVLQLYIKMGDSQEIQEIPFCVRALIRRHDNMCNDSDFLSCLNLFHLRVSAHNFIKVYLPSRNIVHRMSLRLVQL